MSLLLYFYKKLFKFSYVYVKIKSYQTRQVFTMANKVFALVGPYASGKSTLVSKLMDLGVHYIPVYSTSDAMRLKKDKRIVNFVSKADFSKGDWMVKVAYKGDYFGIKKQDMLESVKNNRVSVTMLDQNGVKQLSKLMTGHLRTIYLMSDYVNLVDRMIRLGLNNMDMKYHLEYAESNNEFNFWKMADYIIKNTTDIDTAFNQLMAIMGLSVNAPRDVILKLNQTL